jgi:hypothetical protein
MSQEAGAAALRALAAEAFDALLLDELERWSSGESGTFFDTVDILAKATAPFHSDSEARAAQKHKLHLWTRATHAQSRKMRSWVRSRRSGAAPEVTILECRATRWRPVERHRN